MLWSDVIGQLDIWWDSVNIPYWTVCTDVNSMNLNQLTTAGEGEFSDSLQVQKISSPLNSEI